MLTTLLRHAWCHGLAIAQVSAALYVKLPVQYKCQHFEKGKYCLSFILKIDFSLQPLAPNMV